MSRQPSQMRFLGSAAQSGNVLNGLSVGRKDCPRQRGPYWFVPRPARFRSEVSESYVKTEEFEDLLVEKNIGGARTLAECSGRMDWPKRGFWVIGAIFWHFFNGKPSAGRATSAGIAAAQAEPQYRNRAHSSAGNERLGRAKAIP